LFTQRCAIPVRRSAACVRTARNLLFVFGVGVALVGGGGTPAIAASRARSTPSSAASTELRMYVIGDGWSSGLQADPRHTLGQDAAADLHWQSSVNAVAGSGYVSGSARGKSYPQRAATIPSRTRADVFILQGGSNDQAATVSAESAALGKTVTTLQHRFPHRPVIVLGPGADAVPVSAGMTVVDGTLRAAAHRLKVAYISMLGEQWITSANVDRVIAKQHPTVAGDRYLGGRLAADLQHVLLHLPPWAYFIGDSWSSGLYADPRHTLDQDAADVLRWRADVNAVSGSGYIRGGSQWTSYGQRATGISPAIQPDLFIIQGGSNDPDANATELSTAVANTVNALRARSPNRPVVMLGPGPDPWPYTPAQTHVDSILAAEAKQLAVPYISILAEHWITAGNVDQVIDRKNHHPTVPGDRYLGTRLATDLRHLHLQ
jgi:hypothetical protein